MIKDYFILALKNLRRRKLRSWLTIIGIFISIGTIFVLISISLGLQKAVEEQFRILGTDKFFIMPKGYFGGFGGVSNFDLGDVDAIKKTRGVKEVFYLSTGSVEVAYEGKKRYVMATGLPLNKLRVFEEVSSYKIDEGKMLKEGDKGVIVIGSQYKYNNYLKKPIKVGNTLLINGKEFKVKGIFNSLGNSQDDRMVYFSFEDFNDLYNSKDKINQIIVQVVSPNEILETAKNVKRSLLNHRGLNEKTRDFEILTPEELLESFSSILNIVTGFLLSIALISLLVGGIGIANTMFTSVIERTREIGIMKAIGAKNRDILFIFLIESGLLGLVGGIIGILLGTIMSFSIEFYAIKFLETNLLKAAISFYLILGLLLFSFFVGMLSGIIPSLRATRIKPVEALRYE